MNKSDTLDIVREVMEKRERFSKNALKGILDNPQAGNFIGNLLRFEKSDPPYHTPLNLISVVEEGILSDFGLRSSNMRLTYGKPLREAFFRSIMFLLDSGESYQTIKQESKKFSRSQEERILKFLNLHLKEPSWKAEALIKSWFLKEDIPNCPVEKIPATSSGTSENELKLKYSSFVLRPSGFCLRYSEYLKLRAKIQREANIKNFDHNFQISIADLHQTLFFLLLFFAEKKYLPFKDQSIVTSTANFGKIVVVKIKNGKSITIYELKSEKKEDLLFRDSDIVKPLITF